MVLSELSRGWAIGSAQFRAKLKDEWVAQAGTIARFELLGADREAHLQARAELWEEQVQVVAAAFKIDLAHLPSFKSAREKLWVAAMMKRITSVSNRWLAERLQLGHATSVGSLLHRFDQRGETKSRAFRSILSQFSVRPPRAPYFNVTP